MTCAIRKRYLLHRDGENQLTPDSSPARRPRTGNKAGSDRTAASERLVDDQAAELEESEARLHAVIDNAVDAIISIDAGGIVQSFNPAAEKIFGYSAAECIGQNVSMLMPEPDHSQHDGYLRNFLTTGETRIIGIGREVIGRRKDGEHFPMDLSVSEFRVGEERMFAGICRDVTERRRDQDEIAAVNKELESFAYSVSHDLRAPLRAIDGFSQALIEDYGDRLEGDGKEYLGRIRAAAQRMSQLIDDMLSLSRVTRSEMKRESVDLSELAKEIVQELQNVDPNRDVKIDISPGMKVRGDGRLLRIVLENLLGNAWKFTAGAEAARIELGITDETGKSVIQIRDNGAGFDMDYAEKLFLPFQRLHSAQEFPGTGVGLATVARIVLRHGGRIWAEGVPGQGATFCFTLSG